MDLREIRKDKKLTQKEAATLTGVSLRTYKTYENDIEKEKTARYAFMVGGLSQAKTFDEEHGLLQIREIKEICEHVFQK